MTIEKREYSPVDATIINGSKLLGSPKIDPIKMNRSKKAAGLLLQISHSALRHQPFVKDGGQVGMVGMQQQL